MSVNKSSRSVSTSARMVVLLLVVTVTPALHAQSQTISCTTTGNNPCWSTASFDNHRDAFNPNEATLLSSTVCSYGASGCTTPVYQHAILAVDGSATGDLPSGQRSNPVYASPLYVPNIKINGAPSGSNCYNGGTCNLVVATTLNGTVFAWDADTYTQIWNRQGNPSAAQGSAGNALWWDDCSDAGAYPSAGPAIASGGGVPFFGSVSTGVIDFSNTTSSPAVLYMTNACTDNATPTAHYGWFLHGIDLLTGHDISGSPIAINPAWSGGSAVPLNSPCTGGADGCASCTGDTGCPTGGYWITIDDQRQNQKPALLMLTDTNVDSAPMIYVALGAFNEIDEGSSNNAHGWVVRFKTTSGTLQTPTFVLNSSNAGHTSNSNSPKCVQSDEPTWYAPPSSSPVLNYPVSKYFPYAPNQCGHGSTPWQSTRGITASNVLGEVNSNVFDIYVGMGNGPAQTGGSAGSQNLGDSLLHIQSSQDSATAYTAFAPVDYFTPVGQQQWPTGAYLAETGPNAGLVEGGAQNCGPISAVSGTVLFPTSYTGGTPCMPAIQPPQVDSACPCTTGQCNTDGVSYTFCTTSSQVESDADWDQSVSGEILFEDPNDESMKVVTVNKDGIGHLLSATNLGGANTYDTSDLFTFGANYLFCYDDGGNFPGGPLTTDCDRITSMAMYYYSSGTCGGSVCTWLLVWPTTDAATDERLTALQITPTDTPGLHWQPETLTGTFSSGNWVQNTGGGGDGTNDGQYQLTGTGTSFGTQVIPGDVIVCGCTVAAANCPVITKVRANATPPYIVTASGAPSGCTPSSGLEYAGYFINPRPDATPPPQNTGYPGGSVVVDSNENVLDSDPVYPVIWTVIPNDVNWDNNPVFDPRRGQGHVYAYNGIPDATTNKLKRIWTAPTDCQNSSGSAKCQYFCANSFTLPTVAHGQVFIGTDAILPTTTTLSGGSDNNTVHCPTDSSDDTFPTFTSGIMVLGE
jgi:hypothetical protein